MAGRNRSDLAGRLARAAHALEDSPRDYDGLLERIGDARFVLIGEASHGTHEFYDVRAQITRRLVEEKGFNGVVAEADWPDAWRVNRFVRGFDDDGDADAALSGFKRFPQWMWRNTVVLDFVNWLRGHNAAVPRGRPKTGFYGMDLYSLHGSIHAVLEYLDKVDPEAGRRARYRYGCFEDFGEDPQAYGYAAGFDLGKPCRDQVVQQLMELRARAGEYANRDGRVAEDEYFYAEQNARLVKNAEEYYRQMFEGRVSTWNLRDRHMADTLEALSDYLREHCGRAKLVVWAHNSHLGDARATEVAEQGELNVGQLARERWGAEAFNVGFSTYTGSVTASADWGGAAEFKRVRPGLPGSYEALFHETGPPRFLLDLRDRRGLAEDLLNELRVPRLQRAIGVIYRPDTERISHYFQARLAEQFDAMIHLDETRALEPLERTAEWGGVTETETYPSGV